MNIHIKSFFISTIGILQILISLPFARFFYSIVGQIPYFAIMQLLVIFLVLGVGADDVFVLVDAWKQSHNDIQRVNGELENVWLKRRMVSTYGRTLQSVFNTSFTTAMAFISTAVSPVMPIAAFGIYAALCIVVNYIFIITLTPPALILHHRYFGGFENKYCTYNNKYCCYFKANPPSSTSPPSTTSSTSSQVPTEAHIPSPISSRNHHETIHSSESYHIDFNQQIQIQPNTPILAKILISMFEFKSPSNWKYGKNFQFIAFICVVINLTVAVFLITEASKLELPVEPEQWFPKDHMYERYIDLNSQYLLSNDAEYATISLVWGTTKEFNRNQFNRWKPDKNRGKVKLDLNFDISDPKTLTVISDSCSQLQQKVCTKNACKPFGTLVQAGTVICAVDEFQIWYQRNYNGSIYDFGPKSQEFYNLLNIFRETTAPLNYPSRNWKDLIGYINGQPKFIVVEGLTSIDFEVTNSDLREALSVSEDLVSDLPSTPSAQKVFLASYLLSWYATQNALLRGMYIGLSIAFPVAFGTLVFATKNFIIASYAIVTIGMIVGSVLGCASLEGWSLGISESIVTVIVVGFSVDYTIHLGHMYDHAAKVGGLISRIKQSRYALLKMGSTVLAGAITTSGSGVFMFICQFTFFNKMAFLICVTIAFSLLYSLFFFIPLLYLMGPIGDVGSLTCPSQVSKFRKCQFS